MRLLLLSILTNLNIFRVIHTFQINPYITTNKLKQLNSNQNPYHRHNGNLLMKENEILNNANSQNYKTKSPIIERISPDKIGLMRWIEDSGGSFQVNIENNKLTGGWSLYSPCDVKRGEIIASVPKSICIFSNIEQQLHLSDTNVVESSGSKTSIVNNNLKCNLLESTQSLMMSLNAEKQWRTRLAIALLSERVRSNSIYKMYIQNLPFEFRGVPIFYTSEEFEMIQDLALTQQSRERCRFLSEFVQQVLMPVSHISNTPSPHPFSGLKVDLNSFGWAFSAVSSRAVRSFDDSSSPPSSSSSSSSSSESDSGPALVPGIDLITHNPIDPNCEIIITPENYFLISTKNIRKNEELTVSYGPLSNDELLIDYGFTVNNNPYNAIKIKCDANMINTARVAMNQGTYMNENFALRNKYENVHYLRANTGSSGSGSGSSVTPRTSDSSSSGGSGSTFNKKQLPAEILSGLLGRDSTAYDERWLHAWQRHWLGVLQLTEGGGPAAAGGVTKAVTITGPTPLKSTQSAESDSINSATTDNDSNSGSTSSSSTLDSTSNASLSQIDGKLFALFRVLYSKRESDILQHGYDPFTLQGLSSVLSLDCERQSVKSILGVICIMLFQYETELHEDLELLWKNDRRQVSSTSSDTFTRSSGGSGDNDRKTQTGSSSSSRSAAHRDVIIEVQTFLRNLLYTGTAGAATGTGKEEEEEEVLMQRHIQKVRVNAAKIINEFETNLMNDLYATATAATATDKPSSSASASGVRGLVEELSNSNSGKQQQQGQLTANMREILKYRVRKKSLLVDLVHALATHYQRLTTITTNSSSSGVSSDVGGGVELAAAQSLLAREDRGDRKAKIKDLLNEIRGRNGAQEDAAAAAAKLSAKWLKNNVEL